MYIYKFNIYIFLLEKANKKAYACNVLIVKRYFIAYLYLSAV